MYTVVAFVVTTPKFVAANVGVPIPKSTAPAVVFDVAVVESVNVADGMLKNDPAVADGVPLKFPPTVHCC